MAASENLNRILFSEQFQNLHGMSVGQALQGFGRMGGRVLSPEQMSEEWDQTAFSKKLGPWKENVEKTLSEKRPMNEIVRNWAADHSSFLVGDPTSVARDLRDFTAEMSTQAKTPTQRIYRGAFISPQEQVRSTPDQPLSFTEDPNVATSFAKGGGARGKIFKVEPGQAKGLFVPDYVKRERTVGQGRRPEREWIVDPDTIR